MADITVIRLKLDISPEDRAYLDTLQLLKERNVQNPLCKCATSGCQNQASQRNEIKTSLYGLGPISYYLCDICHSDYKESIRVRSITRY